MKSISDFLDDEMIQEFISVYADKGYDAKQIKNYLRNDEIRCCMPYKSNSKFTVSKNLEDNSYKHYNKTKFIVGE